MRARHRAPRRRPLTVGGRGSPGVGLIVLSVAGLATATVAALLLSGLAGATETANPGLHTGPATGRTGLPQPVRPASSWYSDWSSWGSSGTNCDPMALRWC